jgi:hypothetical protein
VDIVDDRVTRAVSRGGACGRRPGECPEARRLESMTIEMPAAEVHALAVRLTGLAETADDACSRLTGDEGLGPDLLPAVAEFLDCHRIAAGAFASELRLLGATVAGVADSWLGLDEVLLAARGRAPHR